MIAQVGCSEAADVLKCLREIDATKIQDSLPTGMLDYSPIYGDELLPYEPDKAFTEGHFMTDLDILLSTTDDEASMFLLMMDPEKYTKEPNITSCTVYDEIRKWFKPETPSDVISTIVQEYVDENAADDKALKGLIQFTSDVFFTCPSFETLDQILKAPKFTGRVYAFMQTHKPTSKPILTFCKQLPWAGTCHGDDLELSFGYPLRAPQKYAPNDVELALRYMDTFTTFARKG